jgi:predicted nuclease of predicted toxin-antitoxin system
VRLLFDQNLSPELPLVLSDCFADAHHVRTTGLSAAPDSEVWAYAMRENCAIITKDSDFRQRSFLYGYPPKVIWIGLGNCSTSTKENLLRRRRGEILEFLSHRTKAFLVLT